MLLLPLVLLRALTQLSRAEMLLVRNRRLIWRVQDLVAACAALCMTRLAGRVLAATLRSTTVARTFQTGMTTDGRVRQLVACLAQSTSAQFGYTLTCYNCKQGAAPACSNNRLPAS